jgi:hypothetical protein
MLAHATRPLLFCRQYDDRLLDAAGHRAANGIEDGDGLRTEVRSLLPFGDCCSAAHSKSYLQGLNGHCRC